MTLENSNSVTMKLKLNNIATAVISLMTAVAFVSCQKPQQPDVTSPEHGEGVLDGTVLTFTGETPSTKTEWNGNTIYWSAGDAISMTYSQAGEWAAAMYESEPLPRNSAFAGFNVPTDLAPAAEGPFAFYTVSPAGAVSSSSASVLTLSVPMNQTPSANSYDKSADLMVGHSEDQFASVPENSVPLLWNRLVAHAEITLASLNLADEETLESVTLTMDEGLAVSGKFSYDMSASKLTATENVSNSVVLDASGLSVDMTGSLKLWAAFMPCEVTSITVDVKTSENTYTRVISDCNLDFKVNKRNTLEIKMTGLPSYPTVIAHRGCWFKNDVPEHSLAAVRMAKRFGYKVVEIDIRETSDGVMMVLHDQTLKRTMRNASDYSQLSTDVDIADITYDELRSGYVMASDNPEYREPMRSLEEILNECKKYGLKAMMHTSNYDAYRMAHSILGDGNWYAFNSREHALTFARTLSQTVPLFYSVGASVSIADLKTSFEGWGGPCGVSTMTVEQLTPEYNKALTDAGYLVQASVFDAPYEWQATSTGVTHHLTNFVVMPNQKMNTLDTVSASNVTLAAGQEVSKKWATMDYGATILRLKFSGELTVKVNGTTYTMTSDGSKEECIGKRFHAGAPSFSIAATSEIVIEYYEASLKEPVDL